MTLGQLKQLERLCQTMEKSNLAGGMDETTMPGVFSKGMDAGYRNAAELLRQILADWERVNERDFS